MYVLFALGAYATYVQSLGGVLAPFLAKEFGLGDAGVTAVAGVASLGALGAALLTRLADRHGRRLGLLLCFAPLPLLALASAASGSVASYALAQLGVTALYSALLAGAAVALAERSSDGWRAEGQSWFGLAGALGGGLAIGLAAFVERLPFGWRALWLAAALPLLATGLVWRTLTETSRFEEARARGRIAATRAGDLLRGAYRRRALGLLFVSLLRPIAFVATTSWPFYHMVRTMALPPALASLVFVVGGGVGQLGNPIGAKLADLWGRRPTSILGGCVATAAGVAFYWVPAGPGALAWWIALTAGSQGGIATLSVSDRLLGSELFPTALRTTFAGASGIAQAAAAIAAQFGISLLAASLGGLPAAITWISLATFVPALLVFVWVVPETRGLPLAALEDELG